MSFTIPVLGMRDEATIRREDIDPMLGSLGYVDATDLYLCNDAEFNDVPACYVRELHVRNMKCDRDSERRGFADYVLFVRGHPVAVIEAKREGDQLFSALAQGCEYAAELSVDWVYASDGPNIEFRNMVSGEEGVCESYMSPEDFDTEVGTYRRVPRHYQHRFIKRAVQDFRDHPEDGGLLCMATGTGKTTVCFETLNQLKESGDAKVVLFLVDTDELRTQTLAAAKKDYWPSESVVIKNGLKSERQISNWLSGQAGKFLFVSTYQTLAGWHKRGINIRSAFASQGMLPDIVVCDEAHRSIHELDSEYAFSEALSGLSDRYWWGLTATPKANRSQETYRIFSERPDAKGLIGAYDIKQAYADGWIPEMDYIKATSRLIDEGKVFETEDGKEYGRRDIGTRVLPVEAYKQYAEEFIQIYKQYGGCTEYGPTKKGLIFTRGKGGVENLAKMLNRYLIDLFGPAPPGESYVVAVHSDKQSASNRASKRKMVNSPYPVFAVLDQMWTAGVDIPTLEFLCYAKQINEVSQFLQSLGRGTRWDDGKESLKIVDFGDHRKFFDDLEIGDILFNGETRKIGPDVKPVLEPYNSVVKAYDPAGINLSAKAERIQVSARQQLVSEVRGATEELMLPSSFDEFREMMKTQNWSDECYGLLAEAHGFEQPNFQSFVEVQSGEVAESLSQYECLNPFKELSLRYVDTLGLKLGRSEMQSQIKMLRENYFQEFKEAFESRDA